MFDPLIASLLALTPPTANADPNAAKQQMIYQIGMIVVMGVVFWVLLIRPQQKRAKQQAELLKNIKSGDRVITSSGIVGIVKTVRDTSVTIQSGDAKLEVLKSAISETSKTTETNG
jgi:preprotein translocase subunit YajC